ncbi:hypothetical protein NOCARDAX2BIS_50071 [Nocardioides sp. AX2bis]|nr:hypothetical protein NOCARDAX2BIS_50071 [Nocardioides sp. AX2bis]
MGPRRRVPAALHPRGRRADQLDGAQRTAVAVRPAVVKGRRVVIWSHLVAPDRESTGSPCSGTGRARGSAHGRP